MKITAIGPELEDVLRRLKSEGRRVCAINRGGTNATWIIEVAPLRQRQSELPLGLEPLTGSPFLNAG